MTIAAGAVGNLLLAAMIALLHLSTEHSSTARAAPKPGTQPGTQQVLTALDLVCGTVAETT
jgi:hypothetical protein